MIVSMSREKMLYMWGALDIFYILWVLIAAVLASKIPFYTDLKLAYGTAFSYENNMPIYGAWIVLLLNLSILMSGVLLIQHKYAGVVVSCVQFPFRLFLFMPSIFFLPFIIKNIFFIESIWIVYMLIIFTEIYKLFSLLKR